MNHFPPFLALVSDFVDTVSVQKNLLTSGVSQFEVILLALLGIALLSFAGVFVFRKQLLRRKRRHHHHRNSNSVGSGLNGHGSTPPDKIQKHGKRRRVRRRRHQRNPTLAETRGLPPNRDEQAMVPPSS